MAEVIQQEPRNEAAWLLLADAVERKEHAIDCLERVLKINPNDKTAREKLLRLREIDLPPASPQPPPTVEPVAKTFPSALSESSPPERTAAPQLPIVRATKKCPYCAEDIVAEATVCPVCERDVASPLGLPVNAPEPPTIKKSARSRLGPIVAIILVVFIIFVASKMGFYTVQPIGALPDGVTLMVWRTSGEPFFNSPDGACIRIQGGVSLLCRMAALSQAPVDRIILRLPYMEWAYLMSTGGQVFER